MGKIIVPKKDGGLRPILDLRLLNRSVMRLKFKMLTVKQVVSQIRSEDWFVTIDLKYAFHVSILPRHRKFLRFSFRGKAYQYRVLPFGLALSPRTSRSDEIIGVKTKCQEKCAVSITEDHLSRNGVGFDHDSGTFVSSSDRIDSHYSQESQRRPVTHCQAVSKTVGSDGSCVQRDTFWPAVHETPKVVAQDQGVLPEGKPALHDQGNASDGSIPDRLGGGHGLWSGLHLIWHINCLGMLAVFRALKHFLPDLRNHHVLVRTYNTAGCFLYQPPGRSTFAPLIKAGAPDPCVVPGQVPLTESSLNSWASPCRSRHPVEAGAEAGEWRLHPEVVKQILRVFGQAQVDLFATRQTSHCLLWFSLTLTMVQTWPRLHLYTFPPIALLPGVPERVRRNGVRLLLVAPFWPGRVWFSDLISLLDSSPWEIPVRRDLLSQAEGMILHPRPELWKLWVWP